MSICPKHGTAQELPAQHTWTGCEDLCSRAVLTQNLRCAGHYEDSLVDLRLRTGYIWLQTSVASYNDKLDRLNGDDETRTSIVERLRTFDDQLEAIKAEEQEARDKLTALQQKEEKKYEDIPALKEVSSVEVMR